MDSNKDGQNQIEGEESGALNGASEGAAEGAAQNFERYKNAPAQPKGKTRLKKSLIIAIASLTGLSSAAVIAAKQGYDFCFKRYNRPDYATTPGICCIERCESLAREELYFPSDGVRLKGYYYPCENAKGLTVLCHGIHSGADDYLPIAQYLVNSGYAVFSFDYKGTYDSEGNSTVGMCESLVDLDHALNFIESSSTFSGMPLFLIGHSWGGYAAASVLAIHKNVNACATLAAPNDGFKLILEMGEKYAGKLASKGIPELFLDTYQRILFKRYTEYNAVKGINSTKIPVLVAHGKKDKTIDINRLSIVSHKNLIRKEGVTYYITDGALGGHNSLWHSERAYAYSEEIDAKLKELKNSGAPQQEIINYVAGVNHALYSEVNSELFDNIVDMFDSTL